MSSQSSVNCPNQIHYFSINWLSNCLHKVGWKPILPLISKVYLPEIKPRSSWLVIGYYKDVKLEKYQNQSTLNYMFINRNQTESYRKRQANMKYGENVQEMSWASCKKRRGKI